MLLCGVQILNNLDGVQNITSIHVDFENQLD